MNPIERALGIVLALTGGKRLPATELARRFEVSLRTVYRDMDRLIGLGVPVDLAVIEAHAAAPEVEFTIGLPGDGHETEVFFSDLGHEYVTINADYRS